MKRGLPVRRSRAAEGSRFAGSLAMPILVIEAVGVRAGAFPSEAVLPVLALGIALAILALCLGVYAWVDIWKSGAFGLGPATAGIVYATPVLVLLTLVVLAAIWYPPLNDVSTDVDDPPVFTALAPPGAAQFGPELAARQVEAYPELTPAIYPLPLHQVYSAARTLLADRGWSITYEAPPPLLTTQATQPPGEPETAEAPGAGTTVLVQSTPEDAAAEPVRVALTESGSDTAVLEAVAATPLFGFADLVALRLATTPEGTQLDMRSASQIGRHDLGQNARRIRAFMADLDVAIQAAPEAPPVAPATPATEDVPAETPPSEEAPAGE